MGSELLLVMDSVKVEDDESLLACRICLSVDSRLYSICESGLEATFSQLMGVSLSVSDGLPQHLCGWCRAQLLRAQALRARSHRAQQLLEQALAQQPLITTAYIRTIDRAKHKLTHTLSKVCLKACIHYSEQENTQTNTSERLCSVVVKDEVGTAAKKDPVRNKKNSNFGNAADGNVSNATSGNVGNAEADILQLVIIENDRKFDVHFDDVDHSDDEIKSNIQYKMENDNIETKPALAEVKILETDLEKRIKRVGLKRGRHKNNVNNESFQKIQRHENLKAKKPPKKIKEKTVNDKNDKEKDSSEPGRFFTIEEIEEFVKKYNFEIQYLTDEEMLEDMEKRKVSDRYKHCKFKCTLCYKGFLTTTTFDNHMKKDHDPRNAKNECRLCRVSYRYGFYLRQHEQNAHRLRLRCGECGDAVWGRQECVAHAARHAGVTRQCKHCGKHFLKKSSYTWHMRAAHPAENAAAGSCELCGEIYTSPKGLRAHKLLAHKAAAPELQCPRCRAQFDDAAALRRHRELQADDKCDPNSSPCAKCGAGCAGAEALLRHLHARHQVDIFTCDICNKSFLSKPSLSTHIDRVHLGIRPLQHHQLTHYRKYSRSPAPRKPRGHDHMCEHCGKAYTTHQFLKNHQMTHTGERPYKCDRCPKGFTTAVQLTWHTRTHTGERPFQCEQCHQAFSLEGNLRRHRKTVHLGLRKNVPCARCDKTFSSNSTLKLHVRTVHDGAPWPRRARRPRPPRPTPPRPTTS